MTGQTSLDLLHAINLLSHAIGKAIAEGDTPDDLARKANEHGAGPLLRGAIRATAAQHLALCRQLTAKGRLRLADQGTPSKEERK